jgi:hypothetical protein
VVARSKEALYSGCDMLITPNNQVHDPLVHFGKREGVEHFHGLGKLLVQDSRPAKGAGVVVGVYLYA